jgi:hypothetical protein
MVSKPTPARRASFPSLNHVPYYRVKKVKIVIVRGADLHVLHMIAGLRQRAAHDRRQTNAMRLLSWRTQYRAGCAFRQNPLWITLGLSHCLRVFYEALLMASKLASVAHPSSQVWRQFNPASQSCSYGKICFRIVRQGTFSQRRFNGPVNSPS